MKEYPTKTQMLLYFLKGCKRYFLISIVFASLVSLFDLLNPKIIEITVDSVIGDKPVQWAFLQGWILTMKAYPVGIAVVVAVVALIGACFRYLFQLFNSMAAEKFVHRMRNTLFDHILELPFSWHDKHHTGDVIQRCTTDVDVVKTFVSEQLTSLFRVILMIVFSVYFMMQIHWKLALVASFYIPVMVIGSLFFHKKIGTSFDQVEKESGKLSSIVQENLTGIRVIRAFGKEKYEDQRFQKQNHYYTDLWISLQRILASFYVLSNVISTVRDLIVTVVGAVFCVQGTLTAGQFIAFLSYNALLTNPVRRLGRMIAQLSEAGVSIDRLRFIMNAPTEDAGGSMKPALKGELCFDHVSFGYENQKVLDDISFTVPAHTTLGILGTTGSGKSTIVSLLDRLYEVQSGTISIDGIDIRSIDRKWLRNHIGYVIQEPYLFSGTLEENIRMSAPEGNMEKMTEIAGLKGTIEHFTDGYQTYVGQRGITLSGGQKQRVAIAQMLMRKTPIMVFDDSLSAVDAKTDRQIQKALQEYNRDTTVLLIGHRISTLKHADQILVMHHGKIIQKGTHEQLIGQPGFYRKVYEIQTGYEGGNV